jgi:hypothetical protein
MGCCGGGEVDDETSKVRYTIFLKIAKRYIRRHLTLIEIRQSFRNRSKRIGKVLYENKNDTALIQFLYYV